jgi:putative cardiolipin synthase
MSHDVRHYSFWPRFALALVFSVATGCASIDFDYPKEESFALSPAPDTYFGQQKAKIDEAPPGESSFHLLINGIEALAARWRMAAHAERTIDVQYYLITNDRIGVPFIGTLLKAADRGVRVRLLLDDIQTKGYDAGLAALDSHPYFEVRVFNPFNARASRISVFDIERVNRRMHNKSFTVDNQLTIIGGRNIAAEYFAARDDVNFGDVDVLATGPVVRDVSQMFDTYWNHRAAVPVRAFADAPKDPDAALEELRSRIDEQTDALTKSEYVDAFGDSMRFIIDLDLADFISAPYELAYDSPDKSDVDLAARSHSITTPLRKAVARAEHQLVIVSPYFVPLDSGVAFLTELQERGVDVIVITNSLASTNHAVVHSGYAPYRKRLLQAGVRIYEVHPKSEVLGVDRGKPGAALATLHTKGFVVDRNEMFFGSFNWDPRSAKINTELGVIIESAELAEAVLQRIAERLDSHTFEVVLDEKDRIRWVDRAGNSEIILDKEPQTSWWRRFQAGFYGIFPIEEQL